jgi:hypothetical protein
VVLPRRLVPGGPQRYGAEGYDSDDAEEDCHDNGRSGSPPFLDPGNLPELLTPEVAEHPQVLQNRHNQRHGPDADQGERDRSYIRVRSKLIRVRSQEKWVSFWCTTLALTCVSPTPHKPTVALGA